MTELMTAVRASLNAAFPATLATVSADGVPNITYISKVLYVDETHVALTNQFFRKTRANLEANPHAMVMVVNPADCSQFQLELEFEGSLTQGPVFERLQAELDTIATLFGMADVMRLRSADLFRVCSCVHLPTYGAQP